MPPRNEHTRILPRPDEHAHAKIQPGETAGDQSHSVNLRNHISERTQDGREYADGARNAAAVTRTEKIRNGELPELAQIWGQQQGHQHEASGPAQHEGEAVITGQIQRAGQIR